jgi:acetyl-CoA carboxylase biotin carboxyl carrier protein
VNLRELKEIFRLVEKTDFNEVEISQGDIRIRIERGKGAVAAVPAFAPVPAPAQTAPPAVVQAPVPAVAAPAAAPATDEGNFQYVTSPFVGTFYRSPAPDAAAYVEVGTVVKEGQPLCIVEAMKLMNEIESDFAGRVVEIYVENAKPVEFGQKLFRIETPK